MNEIKPQSSKSNCIDRELLEKLKLRAMRSGVWYKVLPRIDRVLFDLTIKVARCVRSGVLASSILSIASKLEGFLESRLVRAIREIGFPAACKLSLLASKWGNRAAENWSSDFGFAKYLAVIRLNDRPRGW